MNMQRRTFLRWLVSGAAALPMRGIRLHAQATAFPVESVAVLRGVAPVVLPSELKSAGHDKVVNDFVQWLSSYRSGADRAWGYGSPRKNGTPAIDPARYVDQLVALAGSAGGSAAFVALPLDVRRQRVIQALDASGIRDLPSAPNGQYVLADFMSFFFSSGPAYDLAYGANIRRGTCRGLAGSSARPTTTTVGD